jgi:hypothetical protein
VRNAAALRPSRIGRCNLHHPPIDSAVAEEHARTRAEFLQLPASIHPFQDRGDEHALEIRPGWQLAGIQYRAIHIPHRVPAGLLGGLERIE